MQLPNIFYQKITIDKILHAKNRSSEPIGFKGDFLENLFFGLEATMATRVPHGTTLCSLNNFGKVYAINFRR